MFFKEYESDVYAALERLSVKIPSQIIDKEISSFKSAYIVDLFTLHKRGDFGSKKLIAFVKDKNEMFFQIMCALLREIGLELEVYNRAQEQKKWRYICNYMADSCEKYTENDDFKFNTIYDSRKAWFEFHIQSITELFSIDMASGLIKEYSELINMWYPDDHWKFNQETMEFVEISSSKEIDTEGAEHPQENEIIKDKTLQSEGTTNETAKKVDIIRIIASISLLLSCIFNLIEIFCNVPEWFDIFSMIFSFTAIIFYGIILFRKI